MPEALSGPGRAGEKGTPRLLGDNGGKKAGLFHVKQPGTPAKY